jgi:hypothetical protein
MTVSPGSLRDRLRRFGGVVPKKAPDAGSNPPVVNPQPAAGPEGIRSMLKKREARGASLPRPKAAAPGAGAVPFEMEWSLVHGRNGPVPVRTLHYPAPAIGPEWSAELISYYARDGRLSNLDATQSVFLDTETTSLSGGAGVFVFLVGLGRLLPSGMLQIRQYFLDRPSREPALLAAVAEELRTYASAVTFFGKAFDRHRLEDKFRIHGIASNFPAEQHADLYHIAKARFGWKLANGKLRTIEESILDIHRDNDLPGSEAPQAWFDYLAGRPTRLARVFEHHARDVQSLVPLLIRCGTPLDGARAEEALGAAKGAGQLKHFENAIRWARLACGGSSRIEALRLLAEFLQRAEGKERALPVWMELARAGDANAACTAAEIQHGSMRDAAAAGELLALADGLAQGVPVGRSRDELRERIHKLRKKCEHPRCPAQ